MVVIGIATAEVIAIAIARKIPGAIAAQATLRLQRPPQQPNPSRNRTGERPVRGTGNPEKTPPYPRRTEFGNRPDGSARDAPLAVLLLVLAESDGAPEAKNRTTNGVAAAAAAVVRMTKAERIATDLVGLAVIVRRCVAVPMIGTIVDRCAAIGTIAMIAVRCAGEEIVLRCATATVPVECAGMVAIGTGIVVTVGTLAAAVVVIVVMIAVTIAVECAGRVAAIAIGRTPGAAAAAAAVVQVVVATKVLAAVVAAGGPLPDRNRPNRRGRKSARNDRRKPEPPDRMRTAGRM